MRRNGSIDELARRPGGGALSYLGAIAVTLSLAACQAPKAGDETSTRVPEGGTVRTLGEPYKSPKGEIHVIRIQDEYRLLRCIPQGPIAGCYEDVLIVPRESLSENSADGIAWNAWLDVPNVEGLQVAFLGPNKVAFRELRPERR